MNKLAVLLVAIPLVPAAPRVGEGGRVIFSSIHARSLEKNLLGDSAERGFIVYLPPSYDSAPNRRYPVLYLLHGNGGNARNSWFDGPPLGYQGLNIKTAMDEAIAAGRTGEFIVVMPDADTKYSASHYVNSSVNGNWADFITRELIAHVDSTYRTIATPAGRGLAGHSMGGRGALYLAATTPGVYGSVYALSPGRMAFATFPPFDDATWRRVLSIPDPSKPPEDVLVPLGFAAAYSPNPAKPPLYVDLPVELRDNQVVVVGSVFDRWIAQDPVTIAARHPENLRALRLLYMSCGTDDPLIGPDRQMADVLKKAQVRFMFEEYKGDHDGQIRERIESRVIPLFGSTASFK